MKFNLQRISLLKINNLKCLKLKNTLTRTFNSTSVVEQKLYVGNLTWTSDDNTLRSLFSKHGEVTDAFIVRDRLSGKSRGFGFVEMENQKEAEDAMLALNGTQNEGRELRVGTAEDRPPRNFQK